MARFRIRHILTITVLCTIVLFYASITQRHQPFYLTQDNTGYYPLMTDSLLAGHLDMLVQPGREILSMKDPYDPATNGPFRNFHDMSLFKGHYYLYYGIAPVLTLFAPYKILFGKNMSEQFGVFVFATLALLFQIYLFSLMTRGAPHWKKITSYLLIGLAPVMTLTIARPLFYEVTSTSALFFMSTGLFCFYRASRASHERETNVWNAVGSLCVGLSTGCRPGFAPMGLLVAKIAFEGWRNHSSRKQRFAFLASIALPWGIVMGGLAFFNYLRFGNPAEFGMTYSLLGVKMPETFNICRLPINFFGYFFSPPKFSAAIPYLAVQYPFAPNLSKTQAVIYGAETLGILFACPFLLSLLFTFRRKNWKTSTEIGVKSAFGNLALCFLVNFILLGCFGGEAQRYEMDFFPYLLVLTLALWCRDKNKLTNHAFGVLAAVTILLDTAVGISGVFPDFEPGSDNFSKPAEANAGGKSNDYVIFTTTAGQFKCRLANNLAPIDVMFFETLVNSKPGSYYNGLNFEKVVPGFMIQIGNPPPEATMYFKGEVNEGAQYLLEKPGALVLNRFLGPAIGGQFMITLRPAPWLNHKTVAIGEVVEGMDIVRAIGTTTINSDYVPEKPVRLTNVSIIHD